MHGYDRCVSEKLRVKRRRSVLGNYIENTSTTIKLGSILVVVLLLL